MSNTLTNTSSSLSQQISPSSSVSSNGSQSGYTRSSNPRPRKTNVVNINAAPYIPSQSTLLDYGPMYESWPQYAYSFDGPPLLEPPPLSSPSSSTYHPNSNVGSTPTQHVVNYHVHQGECISLQLTEGRLQVIQGPATIRMVSTNSSPPLPIPMQPPPGHMVQQILDQNGTLQHVILSLDPTVASINSPTQNYGPIPYGISPTPVSNPSSSFVPPSNQPHMMTSRPNWSSSPTYPEERRNVRGPTHERLLRKIRTRPNESESSLKNSNLNNNINNNNNYNTYRNGKVRNEVGRQHEDSEESGFGHEDEEETQQLLLELLSNIQAPKESSVSARSALLRWGPPIIDPTDSKFESFEPISSSEFQYEVLLSDKGKDGKYRSIITSNYVECRLTDLRPATEYHIRIHALLDNLKGGASDTVSFTTQPCEPETPFPPKCVGKSKTSINLRWNAPSDNGASILHYILEYEEGAVSVNHKSSFVELYRGRAKNYNVTKLSPSTPYRFRLTAVNELGNSKPSEFINFATMGSPPHKPISPALRDVSKSSLTLLWSKRVSDVDFVLQVDDQVSGHGFLPLYTGPDVSHVTTGLRRNSCYRFRLQAHNDEGSSQWSDEVSYSTLPDAPTAPLRLSPKGSITSQAFKVKWEAPSDDGGSDVNQYNLEIDDGNGWKTVFQGNVLEKNCSGLTPGHVYKLRVSCLSRGGVSPYSEILSLKTESIVPGPCSQPRLHGKPKAHSLTLKWSQPERDGGSQITDFEVEMTVPDGSSRRVYLGSDLESTISSLLPGKHYSFQVRAHNRVGFGPWSEFLKVTSGAGPPDPLKEINLLCCSKASILAQWEEPFNNGANITEYHLEMARLCNEIEDTEKKEEIENEDYNQSKDSLMHSFSLVYSGSNLSTEIKNLAPATIYVFRIHALNSAGFGPYSKVSAIKTNAGPPGVITSLKVQKVTCESLCIYWESPKENGEPITSYNVEELSGGKWSVREPSFELGDLKPETSYGLRVQGVNVLGSGPFSTPLRLTTLGLPPMPPKLELVTSNANSLKLKWGEGKNPTLEFCLYHLEMENLRGQFAVVYSGTSLSTKINKLTENTKHRFRIYASNDAGQGPPSRIYEFQTLYAHPPSFKNPPKVNSISDNGCLVEWNSVKLLQQQQEAGSLYYKVQLTKNKDQSSRIIYKGTDVMCRVNGLTEKSEYSIKVAAVRVMSESEMVGTFSIPAVFTTLSSSSSFSSSSSSDKPSITETSSASNTLIKPHSSFSKGGEKTFTDQQWAFIILCGFTLFAIFVAVFMHQILGWEKNSS